MRQIGLTKVLLATAAFAAALFVGSSDQHRISLSIESAQAKTRIYIAPYYYNPYSADASGTWYAVRAYYAGGPWSGTAATYYSYTGWDDYAKRNGIGCTPGTITKGGDGINYVCQ
jgi:hypothetical protein